MAIYRTLKLICLKTDNLDILDPRQTAVIALRETLVELNLGRSVVADSMLEMSMRLLILSSLPESMDPLVACRLGSIKSDRFELAPAAGQSLLIADLVDSCWPGAAI